MAAPLRPASSKAFQTEKWLWIPAVANLATPAIAEINAAAGLDISCMLFASTGRPSKNTNKVTKERRICDGAQYQQIGLVTYEGGSMLAQFDPQGAALSNGVKAWEKFPAGTTGFLVRRMGIAVATDFAVGQFVDIFPTEFDEPFPTTVGEGEAAENAFTSDFVITGPPAFKKAITA